MRNMFSVPLVGGAPYGGQLRALKKGVQVIIATPGRLIDHMREGRVDLSKLDMLILDEADRMLDMGFADDIKEILQNTPQTRQTV
ncbi:DEAD/DEAH box helicase, partial [Stenotrophomonas maltophilia]